MLELLGEGFGYPCLGGVWLKSLKDSRMFATSSMSFELSEGSSFLPLEVIPSLFPLTV